MGINSAYDTLPKGLVDPREMKIGMRLGGEFPNGKRIDLRYFIADIRYDTILATRFSGEPSKIKCWDIIEDRFVDFEGEEVKNFTKTRATSFFNYKLTKEDEYKNWNNGDLVVFINPKKLTDVKNPVNKHIFMIADQQNRRVTLIDGNRDLVYNVPKSLLQLYNGFSEDDMNKNASYEKLKRVKKAWERFGIPSPESLRCDICRLLRTFQFKD